MMEITAEIRALIDKAAAGVELAGDEYIDPADGLIHCKKCGGQRQTVVPCFGKPGYFMPRCICQCQQEAEEQRKAAEERQRRMERIKRRKAQGLQDRYAVYTDLKTSADHLAKLTIRSFFRNTKQIQNYMNFLALDMQLATKFVGVYMQVLDYLGDNQSVQLISARYQYVLKDFFTKGIGKKNISADEILQMNYPYTESNRFC